MTVTHIHPRLCGPLAALAYLLLFAASSPAEVVENGSLLEFYSGVENGCAYDNWVSHTVEADEIGWDGNFAPPELDRETNGFGRYQLVDSLANPDQALADWNFIIAAMMQGNVAAAESRLSASWFADRYQLVRLIDGGNQYLMMREVLNNNYFDDNGTAEDTTDDVRGSFDLGWGLFVCKVNATRPQVIIEVVHPSTDFASPHVAIDAFLTLDAGALLVAGASRNAAFSGATYDESTSLSDPSRNARTPFQEAHKAAVNFLADEWVIQVHGYNAYKQDGSIAHPGVNSVQLSVERENNALPNVPLMSWDYHDIISLTPNPPVPNSQQWPYPEVTIGSYYTAYYPGNYKYRGQITIPNNVDLPGTLSNCQMVDAHQGHNFEYDAENWLHMELDEFPDVAAAVQGLTIAEFYGYNGPGSGTLTYANFARAVHYYHPIFVAATAYLDGRQATPSIVQESASLADFYMGSTANCAYDNWVSHVSEGIARAGYNDYGPAALDRQTTGFGAFKVIPSEIGGDMLVKYWKGIFRNFLEGELDSVRALMRNARVGEKFQLVQLNDAGREYVLLREVLNNAYFDDNGTAGDATDDVRGSFDLGWGLFVRNPAAMRASVVIEVPHPCDDYVTPAVGFDAFNTIDAGCLMVNGAGREVAWTGAAPYDNTKSLSDPTRNSRTPFNMAHQAAVDLLGAELVIAVHSYDTDAHLNSKSTELSAYNDYYPDSPLMDFAGRFDLVSLTPQYPVPANSIGAGNHAAVQVDAYYAAYYGGGYSWQGSIPISNYVEQPGYSQSPQMLYSHVGHDVQNDNENWLHFEHDEFPNVITEGILSFYGAGSGVPTLPNFANIAEYYHPLYQAINRYFEGPNSAPVWTDVPDSIAADEGMLIEFTVTGSDADGDALGITLNPDGLPQGYSFTDNGNGTGLFRWQTAATDAGQYAPVFTLSDGELTDAATVAITVVGPPEPQTANAASEQTTYGTVQGGYANTLQSDNSYEVITEALSGGNPASRTSRLEHVWRFSLTGYSLALHVEAFHNANNEGDDFILAGSFDGVSYSNLLTVTKTADDNAEQSVNIAGEAAGNYYIRVRDANRTAGRTALDRFSVDRLNIVYMAGEAPRDTAMFVDDITLSIAVNRRNTTASGVVTILAPSGTPVASATVSGTWSGLYAANQQAQTDGSGRATFTSANVRDANGYFRLTVTNVAKDGMTYLANLNNETSDTIGVGNRGAGSGDFPAATDYGLPDRVMLSEAFPNPFNARTWVRVGLPETQRVGIILYDLSGRSLSRLFDGELGAGWSAIPVTLTSLPAGEYILRMQTAETVEVRRLVLVR